MRSVRSTPLTAGAALAMAMLVTSGCGGNEVSGAAASPTGLVSGASVSQSAEASASPVEKETEDADPTTFNDSTTVDNTWFPLTPGAQLTLKGTADVDGETFSRDVVATVTDLVKEVDGVMNVVIYELDYTDGVLNEAEIAFLAQDDDGAVWRFGEYPESYEEGKLVEAPTWISGQEGAKAGISMKADPQLDQPSYAQGWGPEVDWKDRAQVVKMGEKTCVQAGCYTDVVVTEEYTVSEPGASQLKSYAPGVGNVKVGWAGEKNTDHEELELVEAATLDAAALAKVREKALALEKHAYEISKNVYGATKPMQPASAG